MKRKNRIYINEELELNNFPTAKLKAELVRLTKRINNVETLEKEYKARLKKLHDSLQKDFEAIDIDMPNFNVNSIVDLNLYDFESTTFSVEANRYLAQFSIKLRYKKGTHKNFDNSFEPIAKRMIDKYFKFNENFKEFSFKFSGFMGEIRFKTTILETQLD